MKAILISDPKKMTEEQKEAVKKTISAFEEINKSLQAYNEVVKEVTNTFKEFKNEYKP